MEDQLDQEFIQEANELFQQAEEALLDMESGREREMKILKSVCAAYTH